jgi:hypothetical protein
MKLMLSAFAGVVLVIAAMFACATSGVPANPWGWILLGTEFAFIALTWRGFITWRR